MTKITTTIPDMNLDEARETLERIEKGLFMERAMDSKIGLVILDFDERGGWCRFQNDDGTQRYKNVFQCLRSELSSKLDVGARQVRRLVAAAVAERQLFGETLDSDAVLVEPTMKRPALPERTLRELARLNDWPDKQKKAWERVMEMADGNPIAKVARQVVDTFTGDYQRRRDEKKARNERTKDPDMKKITQLLLLQLDADLKLCEDKSAPEYVLKKMQAAVKALEEWDKTFLM